MEELQENSKERRNLRVKKCGSYNEGRHSLGGDKRTVQAVACVVRVHSCPHFFIAPRSILRDFSKNEERGCSQDSGEIFKSRVKRVGGTILKFTISKKIF